MPRNVDDAPDRDIRRPRSRPVANEHFVRAADQRPRPVFGEGAHDECLHARAVAVNDAVAVDEREVVVAAAGPDFVEAVAGVDPVVAVAGVYVVALAFGLAGWLVVAPDDVAGVAPVDGVVAVAAEQPVVDVLEADERVAASCRPLVHLQALVGGPAGVTGNGDARALADLRSVRGDAGDFFAGGTGSHVDG